MSRLTRRSLSALLFIFIFLGQTSFAKLKNVIILIGDGMGFEQVKAASIYAYGREGC